MNKDYLIEQLTEYVAFNSEEKSKQERLLQFIKTNANCYSRDLLIGHVTASSWVVNETQSEVLLIHHAKLNKWLQPGGHCDENEDVYQVAETELHEETGLEPLFRNKKIFDVDIHLIPERKGIPEHEHFDIRFLFVVDQSAKLIQNHETNAIKWLKVDEIESYSSEESILRMRNKLLSIQ